MSAFNHPEEPSWDEIGPKRVIKLRRARKPRRRIIHLQRVRPIFGVLGSICALRNNGTQLTEDVGEVTCRHCLSKLGDR